MLKDPFKRQRVIVFLLACAVTFEVALVRGRDYTRGDLRSVADVIGESAAVAVLADDQVVPCNQVISSASMSDTQTSLICNQTDEISPMDSGI